MQKLLEWQADPNKGDEGDNVPLHCAVHHCQKDWPNQDIKMIKLLLAHGADPTHKDESGQSPLDKARSYVKYDPIFFGKVVTLFEEKMKSNQNDVK